MDDIPYPLISNHFPVPATSNHINSKARWRSTLFTWSLILPRWAPPFRNQPWKWNVSGFFGLKLLLQSEYLNIYNLPLSITKWISSTGSITSTPQAFPSSTRACWHDPALFWTSLLKRYANPPQGDFNLIDQHPVPEWILNDPTQTYPRIYCKPLKLSVLNEVEIFWEKKRIILPNGFITHPVPISSSGSQTRCCPPGTSVVPCFPPQVHQALPSHTLHGT